VVEDEIDELDSSPPPEEKDDDDSPGSPTSVALAKGRKTTGRKKEPRPPVGKLTKGQKYGVAYFSWH
jgi:hypothetical protein